MAAGALALAMAGAAHAECTLGKMAEVPVTLKGMRPYITAQVNGKDAVFLVDSGAQYSIITAEAAAQFGLKVMPAPPMEVYGVSGRVQIKVANVDKLGLAGLPISDIEFMIGGVDRPGVAGLIAQNILRFADVEYDLAGGFIRFFKPKGCENAPLAYWAPGAAVSMVALERSEDITPLPISSGKLNGVRTRMLFDTGASVSMMSTATARRLGISATGAGATAGGAFQDLGGRVSESWIAPLENFEFGGEQIKSTRMFVGRFPVVGLSMPDVILGADFFRAHRIYQANSQGKVYFTYAGGAVFNLTTPPEVAPAGVPGAPAPAAGADG
jgi:predicted aspartyl protease